MNNSDQDIPKFGETSEGAWLGDVINNCLKEVGDRLAVDMNLLIKMCQSEPKNAQIAMQVLAKDLREYENSDFSKLPLNKNWLPLLIGSIFQAYCVYRYIQDNHPLDHYPSELSQILERNPVILKSADYVAKLNS